QPGHGCEFCASRAGDFGPVNAFLRYFECCTFRKRYRASVAVPLVRVTRVTGHLKESGVTHTYISRVRRQPVGNQLGTDLDPGGQATACCRTVQFVSGDAEVLREIAGGENGAIRAGVERGDRILTGTTKRLNPHIVATYVKAGDESIHGSVPCCRR